MATVWRGSEEAELQPGYPRFKRTSRGATLTFVFRGPADVLRTYGPAIGDDITLGAFDYAPTDEIVYADSVECIEDEATAATLTIVYSNDPNSGGVLIANQTRVEIEAVLLEKPLIRHPRYAAGGAMALSDDDRRKIKIWEDEPSTGNYNACSANAKDYIDKIRKGIESYVTSYPLVRQTARSGSAPAVGSLGTRTTGTPATGAPAGYQWLKTGDRAVQQAPGTGWERVEEWTGAKEWDADLYGAII